MYNARCSSLVSSPDLFAFMSSWGDGAHGLHVLFWSRLLSLVFTSCMCRTPQFVYLFQDSFK